MKFKVMLVALIAAVITLVPGCGIKPTQSIAQMTAGFCSNLGTVNASLDAFNATLTAVPQTHALGVKATNDLAAAKKLAAPLCAAGATVTSTQLQTLVPQILAASAAIVAELPLPPAQQLAIQNGLVLAQGAVGLVGVVEAQIQAAKAAQAAQAAPAASSTSAGAPQASLQSVASIRATEIALTKQIDASTDTQAAIHLARRYNQLDANLSSLLYPQVATTDR
ncbi:hypothetical protein [Dyella mobilis]|uniref:Lipoprotein n=1 Tax=Dyella mobilis TaxID=1849582 RepID=A0ABS2KK83_9GAMM|nr:hypothetical protein [Dyella mobilis]MBM7131568.1 hypothetical protein [Dyella mobilis]GLQ96460.1 hypothetical protein GCM10007863_08780 [Dyella mobilis]